MFGIFNIKHVSQSELRLYLKFIVQTNALKSNNYEQFKLKAQKNVNYLDFLAYCHLLDKCYIFTNYFIDMPNFIKIDKIGSEKVKL